MFEYANLYSLSKKITFLAMKKPAPDGAGFQAVY